MIVRKLHRAVIFLVVLTVLSSACLAQKKRKLSASNQSHGASQREAEFYFTEGEKYFILEDYAKALLYFQRTLEIDPENGTVHYKIAEVLARGNKTEDLQRAATSIETALKYEKQNKYFYQLAANIYNGLGKFDKAAQVYETLLQEVKGTEEYLYELAAVYQYANKPEEAIKVYNRAENILGINETSSIQKQKLYFDVGKVREAVAEGEKLIAAFPDEERYIMGFAEMLSQKGQGLLAASYLEKFLQQNKESGSATMLLAGIYRDLGQEPKARELLLTAFDDPSIDLTSKVIVLGAYNTELNQGKASGKPNPDKEAFALKLFEKLEKLSASETNVHIVGGDLYLSIGKNHEAQKEYTNAIALGDVNYEVWQNLLYIEFQLDQVDNVIKHSESALELFPNQGMLYYFNGFANARKHHYADAINSLLQAKKLITNNTLLLSEINGLMGDSYYALKEYPKSDEAYDVALQLNSDNFNVLNNYSYYLALRKENLDKAEKMSSALIKNNPDAPSFLDTYAWVLYARGKYKEAKKVMEKAIGTGHASATHLEHYGDILFQLGDVTGAVQQWEKARGVNANNEILNKKIANRRVYE